MANERMRRSEFAALVGISRGRVTQLASEGRLVLSEDGREILVDQTLELLAETCQVEKISDGVRMAIERRHSGVTAPHPVPPQPTTAQVISPEPVPYPNYNRARAENEVKKGEQLDLELAQLRGELVSRVGVLQSMQLIATAMRSALDKMPDNLAARLAAITDQEQIYAILRDEVDVICEACRQSVNELLDEL